ncbi:hypothetical protein GLYMA_20G069250v4 [Glycine max]|nr:hypothetical protein GLYMA_20G069250v4 [Glycine max]KAH1034924.1 hypothetical protein GYH30_055065 [Glycine max]
MQLSSCRSPIKFFLIPLHLLIKLLVVHPLVMHGYLDDPYEEYLVYSHLLLWGTTGDIAKANMQDVVHCFSIMISL